MTRKRHALTTLGSMAIAVVLVSCGVDAGDAASPSGTTPPVSGSPRTTVDTNLTPEQQQMADTMAGAYRDLGFTDEESSCLGEGLAGSLGVGEATPDISRMMDVINGCDIPMDRLMEIQGGMGDGTTDGAMKESLKTGFKASGMTDEEASCVADAFIEKYGLDAAAMMDADKLASIAEGCDVDPSKIKVGN